MWTGVVTCSEAQRSSCSLNSHRRRFQMTEIWNIRSRVFNPVSYVDASSSSFSVTTVRSVQSKSRYPEISVSRLNPGFTDEDGVWLVGIHESIPYSWFCEADHSLRILRVWSAVCRTRWSDEHRRI
ncbi:hypothetical protein Zmor_020289 [Zophobas morio]|uniref:Uncharacterized protein n=1 Tax=Zophobas morio TaxID=2755281 RepID=A0AA38I2P5_9CUCU|nr:hypothetical protein Zmor_020289 [Zophobas morio]